METALQEPVAEHEEKHGPHANDPHAVVVEIRLLPSECQPHEGRAKMRVGLQATLLDILQRGAELFGTEVLPSPTEPWDTLHQMDRDSQHAGPALADLGLTLGEFLKQPGAAPDLGIRLELVFRVNTRWAVAPAPKQTPRQVLVLPKIGLNPDDYTLYNSDSSDALPPDDPVLICHGTVFEAEKDGKYGGA